LVNEDMDSIIDNIYRPPSSLEKRVYYSHMCRRYMDQLTKRAEQRELGMTNMADARKWKLSVLGGLHKSASPVIGYEFDENTASIYSTTKSFRMSRKTEFSGTIETAGRAKKYLGYAAALIILAAVLYGGCHLRKIALDAMSAFDASMTKTEQSRKTGIEMVADPNK